MNRKFKLALFLVLMISVFVFVSIAVNAATAGQINITVKDDNSVATNVPGLYTQLYDPADNAITVTTDMTESGVYKFQNIATAGAYTVKFYSGDGSTGASVVVTVKAGTTAKANLTWVSPSSANADKSGAIAGNVTSGTAALIGVTVKAYKGAVTYITTSNSSGAYKMYVPADTYTLVIIGKEYANNNDFMNLSYSITVPKGRMVGPMNDVNARTLWGTEDKTLGLQIPTIDGNDKSISGYADTKTTVSAYVYDNNTGLYQFIANAAVGANNAKVRAANSGNTALGAYTIKLDTYYPGQRIVVRAQDSALNVYQDDTYKNAAITANSMDLSYDQSDATNSQPITIGFADHDTTSLNGFLNSKIWQVSATYGSATVVLNTTDYKITTDNNSKTKASKITINAGVLSTPQNYTIIVKAYGYNDGSTLQTIGTSATNAPTLSGTFTIKEGGGTAYGSVQFSAVGTKATGDSFYYVVSSQSAIQVKLGNTLSGGTLLAITTDITGADMTDYKYIHVYELSASMAVVKAKVFTLTAAQLKGPSFTTSTGSAATIVMSTNATSLNTTAPNKSAFVVKKGTTVKAIDSITIVGSQVFINLTNTNTNQILNGDTISVMYTKPSSGTVLKDANGNAFSTMTTAQTITNVTPAVKTFGTAQTTSSGTVVEITMSGALTGSSAATGAFVVKKGTTTMTVSSVTVSGTKVSIALSDGPIVHSDTSISVSYTATGTDDLTDGSVKVLNTSTPITVTNNE